MPRRMPVADLDRAERHDVAARRLDDVLHDVPAREGRRGVAPDGRRLHGDPERRMLASVLVDLNGLLLAEARVVVPLDAAGRKPERDRLLPRRDPLLEHGLVVLPLADDLRVRPAPVVDDLERPDELPDLLPVPVRVGVALDAGDVPDDEEEPAVELGPFPDRHGGKVEALRLAGVDELRGPHPVAEAQRRALGETVEVGVLVLYV